MFTYMTWMHTCIHSFSQTMFLIPLSFMHLDRAKCPGVSAPAVPPAWCALPQLPGELAPFSVHPRRNPLPRFSSLTLFFFMAPITIWPIIYLPLPSPLEWKLHESRVFVMSTDPSPVPRTAATRIFVKGSEWRSGWIYVCDGGMREWGERCKSISTEEVSGTELSMQWSSISISVYQVIALKLWKMLRSWLEHGQ